MNPFEPRHAPVVAAVDPPCAERWPLFRPAILAEGGNMDSSCGLSNHGDEQGKSRQMHPPPSPSPTRSGAQADVFEFLPLRLSATLREKGYFLLIGWCSRFSPSGTLWRVKTPGFWADARRLFALIR